MLDWIGEFVADWIFSLLPWRVWLGIVVVIVAVLLVALGIVQLIHAGSPA